MIAWLPLDSADVVKLACPLLSVAEPSAVAPSLNVTVPVAVPLLAATLAVKVTAWPTVDGFADEVNVVAVAIFVLQAALPISV